MLGLLWCNVFVVNVNQYISHLKSMCVCVLYVYICLNECMYDVGMCVCVCVFVCICMYVCSIVSQEDFLLRMRDFAHLDYLWLTLPYVLIRAPTI